MVLGIIASMWVDGQSDRWREEDLLKWRSWPSTTGTPVETRVREKLFGKYTRTRVYRDYILECRVRYSVSGREYSIWVEGDTSLDRKWLTEGGQQCPFSSYDVHYDPKDPEIAHAFAPEER